MALQREAAEIIDLRIADGRPPPDVWRAAAARRVNQGLSADAWYRPDDTAAPARQGPAPVATEEGVGRNLVLRVVDLPLATLPEPAPGRRASFPKPVAHACN